MLRGQELSGARASERGVGKTSSLKLLKEEEKQGIIDLRYFDESGFGLTPYISYAWQEQGATIALESTQSQRLNVLGFLHRHHELAAYHIAGSVTSEVVIQCFDDFCDNLQGPTVVVIENLGEKYNINFV